MACRPRKLHAMQCSENSKFEVKTTVTWDLPFSYFLQEAMPQNGRRWWGGPGEVEHEQRGWVFKSGRCWLFLWCPSSSKQLGTFRASALLATLEFLRDFRSSNFYLEALDYGNAWSIGHGGNPKKAKIEYGVLPWRQAKGNCYGKINRGKVHASVCACVYTCPCRYMHVPEVGMGCILDHSQSFKTEFLLNLQLISLVNGADYRSPGVRQYLPRVGTHMH